MIAQKKTTYLHDWVNDEMIRGRYIFTKDDVKKLNLPISDQALQNSLNRLMERSAIMSPWQNFFVAIPTEYKLRGVVPPSFYIDRLMQFLGRDYYVSLLTAAAFNGASHQKAMVFQVMTNGGPIRSGVKNGTKLEFTLRQNLPSEFTRQIKTQTGYMTVAGPELTALDIVAEENKVGGLSRAAEVLVELCENTSWDAGKSQLIAFFSSAIIQRFGYLLERIEFREQADSLYALFRQSGKTMRKIPLKPTVAIHEDMPTNKRWKIIENYELDIDEI